jgi:hypothetical protein
MSFRTAPTDHRGRGVPKPHSAATLNYLRQLDSSHNYELGHAFERMDQLAATPEWETIMWRCRPLVAHPRYQEPSEFWAEAYAHIATGELRRLTRLLSGHAPAMEMCWAYYRWQLGLEVSPR